MDEFYLDLFFHVSSYIPLMNSFKLKKVKYFHQSFGLTNFISFFSIYNQGRCIQMERFVDEGQIDVSQEKSPRHQFSSTIFNAEPRKQDSDRKSWVKQSSASTHSSRFRTPQPKTIVDESFWNHDNEITSSSSISRSKVKSGYQGKKADIGQQNPGEPDNRSYISDDEADELLETLLEDKNRQIEGGKSFQQYFKRFLQYVHQNLLFTFKPKPDEVEGVNNFFSSGSESEIRPKSLKPLLPQLITTLVSGKPSKSRMRRLFSSCGGWGCGRSTALRGKKNVKQSGKVAATRRNN